MLARIRQSAKTENDKGFTLIELLVVMIIIGILAAIAIPVFLNQRAKAEDSATKSDVTTLGKEIATYYVDNTSAPAAFVSIAGNQYSFNGSSVGRVSRTTISVLKGGTAATFTSPTKWCVSLTNADGKDKDWKYAGDTGLTKGTC